MAEICSFASRRSLVIQIHESTFLFEKMSEFRWSSQNKWCSQSTDFNSCFSCPRHRKLDWKLGEKGWWEWGSRSPPLWCHHSSSHLCSDGTCHEYFSLKWISDNSESNNNVDSRVERNDSLKIPSFYSTLANLNFHFKMIFFVKNSISGVVILTNFKEKKESDAIFSFPTL